MLFLVLVSFGAYHLARFVGHQICKARLPRPEYED
jgi:hypothetical protein